MAISSLNNSPTIWKLAKDLGIKKIGNPVDDIQKFCEKKINAIQKEFPDCTTLEDLLNLVAAKLKTEFCEINNDRDLENIKSRFINSGEKIFANLETEFTDEVLGITFKRTNREPWELEFVSVIDCRENKRSRSYFTKWHEIAHLLVLTDQQRLKFMRTNLQSHKVDPEEAMVDIIAGKFGFYQPFVQKSAPNSDLTFELIDKMRAELCPESSLQAALIGFVQAWPKPCLLAYCEMALKTNEQNLLDQQKFDFTDRPTPLLRATKITLNRPARDISFRIHRNMRVPKDSVIHDLYEGYDDFASAEENLSLWESSGGQKLDQISIKIRAIRYCDGVFALINPAEP
jgi:hypothetical protein